MSRINTEVNYGDWRVWVSKSEYALLANNGKPAWDIQPNFGMENSKAAIKEHKALVLAGTIWATSGYWRIMTLRRFLYKTFGKPTKWNE